MLRQDERPLGERCRERWRTILPALGVSPKFLSGKHGPCPKCGGKDRYRFDDKDGRGMWICSQCGAGDGFALLKLVHGWDFREAAPKVEELIGDAKPIQRQPEPEPDNRVAMKALWERSSQTVSGDVVDRYLTARGLGLAAYPECLRTVKESPFPIMAALVTAPDGSGTTIHRTYLTLDGSGKAPIPAPRKLMPGTIEKGSAIRLCEPNGTLGIAEGIETALSAGLMYDMPVWSALNSGMLAQWIPPSDLHEIIIFGDADPKYGGQCAAFALAHRLACANLNVRVELPAILGEDWNDEWMRIRC